MSKRIVITGSSGLIGSALMSFLTIEGYEVVRLKYASPDKKTSPGIFAWDVEKKILPFEAFKDCCAVINLAGANISDHRWTAAYKNKILESRVKSTTFLTQALAKLPNPPPVFISASAIGYYGNHSSGIMLTEDSPPGDDFLASVCREWEKAANPLKGTNIRTVFLRFGVVLSGKGGALAKMLPIFKLGLGGRLGSGEQMMSWIALEEVLSIVLFCLKNPSFKGPVNCVSPEPVSNKKFTQVLANVLKCPAVLPAPAFTLRLVFGEMANTLLLGGAKVVPQKLLAVGYVFRYPDLKNALEKCLPN